MRPAVSREIARLTVAMMFSYNKLIHK